MSKSYLKGYKDALKTMDKHISESKTRNDLIVKLHKETEWINAELSFEKEKEESWNALLNSIDSTFAMAQINSIKGGIQ